MSATVPTPAAGDREGQVARVLAEHRPALDGNCTCGEWQFSRKEPWLPAHEAHVARALLAPDGPVGTALAEAWERGAAAPRMQDGSDEPAVDNPYRVEAGS